MLIDVTTTETHETVREVRLTGDQFRKLVLAGLKQEFGLSSEHGVRLSEVTIGTMVMPDAWPDVRVSLTTDHLWWRKPTPPDEE